MAMVTRKEGFMKIRTSEGLNSLSSGIQPDRQHGFSMIELLVVVLIVLTLAATTVPLINKAMNDFKITQAEQIVMMQMRYARQMAMDQRRNMRVSFSDAAGSTPARVTISQLDTTYSVVKTIVQLNLPSTMKFMSVGTPSAPESGTTALGSSSTVDFRPDGAAATSSGVYINGYKIISDGLDSATMRAVSVFGTTGRVKSYKYLKGTATWKAE
jgi:prepilin-type N-terminal cleavage/methylation domain-containing protein